MGITVQSIDEILAPYVEKEYKRRFKEISDMVKRVASRGVFDVHEAKNIAKEQTIKELEQGIQAMEIAFNTLPSSRGDFVFVTYTFGLDESEWGQMVSRAIMKVRQGGQGREGRKVPVLFPKLVFLFDHAKHGKNAPMRDLYESAVYCQSQCQFPDLLSLTGDSTENDICDIYKRYGVVTSPMGCRSYLTPYFERGGFHPQDENDKPITVGRGNCGVISLNLPLIYQRAKVSNVDFFEELDYYLNMCFNLHLRTRTFLIGKTASTHPLAYEQGGFYGGYLNPNDKIEEVLKRFTYSIGITALHELTVLHTGKGIYKNDDFACEVMDFINNRCAEFKEKEGIAVATYGTPAESLCGTQVKQFRKMFGIIEGVSDKEYFNNSFHVNVDAEINPFQKQDAEYKLFHKMNGGHIQYCRVLTKDNLQANLALCDRAMDYGYYFGINFADCYCCDCGHNFLDGETCPHCGGHNITEINRVSGYLGYSRIGGDTRMNEAKLADIADRKSM